MSIGEWASFTRKVVAPASAAPSMAAFTSASEQPPADLVLRARAEHLAPVDDAGRALDVGREVDLGGAHSRVLPDAGDGVHLDEHAVEQEPARNDRGRRRVGRREHLAADTLEGVVVATRRPGTTVIFTIVRGRALGLEHGRDVAERLPDLGLGVVGIDDGSVGSEAALAGREHELADVTTDWEYW